jgi:hypothetical protein
VVGAVTLLVHPATIAPGTKATPKPTRTSGAVSELPVIAALIKIAP